MKKQIFTKMNVLVLGSFIILAGQAIAQMTGTVQQDSESWCVFNDWQARDQQARIRGTYDTGRYSMRTNSKGKGSGTAVAPKY